MSVLNRFQFPDEDPNQWSFDVMHASHDEIKEGRHDAHRSHIVISKHDYPDHTAASLIAAQWVKAKHSDHQPTAVYTRI